MFDTVLFAIDIDQVLQIVVFLIIVVSSLAGQFFKGNAKRKKHPRPVKPAQPGQPAAGHERSRLEDEIQAMLRKAVGAEPQEEAAPNVVVHQEAATPRARQEPLTISAELVKPASSQGRESVSEHVSRHLESDSMKRRSRRLGSEIGRTDERLENRLHRTFDHKLGQLESQGSGVEVASSSSHEAADAGLNRRYGEASPLAAQVVEMLRSPADLSTAVLLSEILRRPSW